MKLEKESKIPYAIAICLLIVLYFVPIWQIDLHAPQYPEGIGLYIWINDITGKEHNNFVSVNRLNRYIGMRPIVPEDVIEFQIMPYILGGVIFLGFLGMIGGKRKYLIGWIVILAIMGIAGLIDFYIWLYDYGTNLDPTAPIKVPDMTYIPPLIGTKQLLNISASSYPALGGIAAGLSGLSAIGALFLDKRLKQKRKSEK